MSQVDISKFEELANNYLPARDTLARKVFDMIFGSTPQEQLTRFATPVDLSISSLPKSARGFLQSGEHQMIDKYADDVPQALDMMLQHRFRNPSSYSQYSDLLKLVGKYLGER